MIPFSRQDADFRHGIDRLLKGICQKLQLSPTQHKLAEQHYKAVSDFLERSTSILAPYNPKIYPQGSLPMGVTNKPFGQEEYDLDFICELQILCQKISPSDLFSKFEDQISQHDDYKKRMELGKRCIRLTYAHDFHLDIVPACTNEKAGFGQVKIPDRELETWKDTNSKMYVKWFNSVAEYSQRQLLTIDHAEPLPSQESFDDKSALKFAVQLLKRYRDIAFRSEPDLAPVSIVLSTLSAEQYRGQASVFATVQEILDSIATKITLNCGKRLQVWNTANQVPEDLGERWEQNPDAYEAFKSWILNFQQKWKELQKARGYAEISAILTNLFGEQPTNEIIREDAFQMSRSRELEQLGIIAGSGLLTSQSPKISLPKNTFYGE